MNGFDIRTKHTCTAPANIFTLQNCSTLEQRHIDRLTTTIRHYEAKKRKVTLMNDLITCKQILTNLSIKS